MYQRCWQARMSERTCSSSGSTAYMLNNSVGIFILSSFCEPAECGTKCIHHALPCCITASLCCRSTDFDSGRFFNTSISNMLGAQRSHCFCSISGQGLVTFRRGLRVTHLCINTFKPFLLLSMIMETWPRPFHWDAELLSHTFLQQE